MAALPDAFGNAYVNYTGGCCYAIYVPIEGHGHLLIGDMEGPLGENNHGWGAELFDNDGDYAGPVCKIPDRSVPKLVDTVRALLRDGTRTGMTRSDLPCIRRDQHHIIRTNQHADNSVNAPTCWTSAPRSRPSPSATG
jgi:hypothetical protein